jgi:hypothetical protein
MSAYRSPEVARAAREASLRQEVADLEARLEGLSRRNSDQVGTLLRRRLPWGRIAPWLLGLALGLGLGVPRAVELTRLAMIRDGLYDLEPNAAFLVPGDLDTVAPLVTRALGERLSGIDWQVSPDQILLGPGPAAWTRYREVSAVPRTEHPARGRCIPVLWLEAGTHLVAVHFRDFSPTSPGDCPFQIRNFIRYRTMWPGSRWVAGQ